MRCGRRLLHRELLSPGACDNCCRRCSGSPSTVRPTHAAGPAPKPRQFLRCPTLPQWRSPNDDHYPEGAPLPRIRGNTRWNRSASVHPTGVSQEGDVARGFASDSVFCLAHLTLLSAWNTNIRLWRTLYCRVQDGLAAGQVRGQRGRYHPVACARFAILDRAGSPSTGWSRPGPVLWRRPARDRRIPPTLRNGTICPRRTSNQVSDDRRHFRGNVAVPNEGHMEASRNLGASAFGSLSRGPPSPLAVEAARGCETTTSPRCKTVSRSLSKDMGH